MHSEVSLSDMKKAVSREVCKAYRQFLEPGISDAVAYLNLLGFHTRTSCEGHLDRGCPTPWIHVAASDMPRIERVRQMERRNYIAAVYRVPVHEVGRGRNQKANKEYWKSFNFRYMGHYIPEYRHWLQRNFSIRRRIRAILREYNVAHRGFERVRLRRVSHVAARITVSTVRHQQLSLSYKDRLVKLRTRQHAMKKFTAFLRARYLAG